MTKGIKFFLIFLSVAFVFSLAYSSVLAVESVPPTNTDNITAAELGVSDPGLLPTSRWYFLKDWWRGIKLGLTFDNLKKAELRAEQLNQRLLEVQDLFNQPVDPKTQEAISKALASYDSESEKIKAAAEKLKTKAQNDEKIKKFLEKNTDWELKRQYLLNKMENKEQSAQEIKDQLRQVMSNSLGNLAETISILEKPEEWGASLDRAVEKVNQVRQMYNLETLKELKGKLSGQAQATVDNMEKKTLNEIKQGLNKADEVTQKNLLQEFINLKPSAETANKVIQSSDLSSKIKKEILNQQKLEVQKKELPQAIDETLDLFGK